MAKNLTTYVKSLGANEVVTTGLIPYCTWDFVPTTNHKNDDACKCFKHSTNFCVPTGVCCVRFEIWGGGGIPAGMQNCGYMGPSGSAAYAHKTMTVTPGTCYRVHAGYLECRRNNNGGSDTTKSTARQCENQHTYITGTGLTNFCAEQGCGAAEVCCNLATGTTKSYTFIDSAGEGARYFGADDGVRGQTGWYQLIDSSVTNTDYRQYIQGVPYPGGLINKRGGHIIGHLQQNSGNICCYETASDMIVQNFLGFSAAQVGHTAKAGWGSAGMAMCAGSQNCAGYGAPGRVRITYSCCNCFDYGV